MKKCENHCTLMYIVQVYCWTCVYSWTMCIGMRCLRNSVYLYVRISIYIQNTRNGKFMCNIGIVCVYQQFQMQYSTVCIINMYRLFGRRGCSVRSLIIQFIEILFRELFSSLSGIKLYDGRKLLFCWMEVIFNSTWNKLYYM